MISPRLKALAATGVLMATAAPSLTGIAQAAQPPDVVTSGDVKSGSEGPQTVIDPDADPQLPGSDDSQKDGPAGDDPASDPGPDLPPPPPPPDDGTQLPPDDDTQVPPDDDAQPPPASDQTAPAPDQIAPATAQTEPPVEADVLDADAVEADDEAVQADRPATETHAATPPPAAPPPAVAPPAPTYNAQPSQHAQVPSPAPARTPVAEGSAYVVRSGDTLWDIARRALGPDASPARIGHFVDQLWTLNADVIRSGNPDLIMPGEHLRVPEAR